MAMTAEEMQQRWDEFLGEVRLRMSAPTFDTWLRGSRPLGYDGEIGTPAQLPKPRGNSPGRAKGTRLARRKRHRVVKKGQKTRKTASSST